MRFVFSHSRKIPSWISTIPWVFPSLWCCIISAKFCLLCPPFPWFFRLLCCCFFQLLCSAISRNPSYVLSFPEDSVFHFHHFRDFSIFYVPSFPENSFHVPSLPRNSVFHLHHFRDSSVSYVPSFPETSVCHSHHFHDFFVSNVPETSVCHSHHFHVFSVSYVPSFLQNSVFHVPWFFRLLCACITSVMHFHHFRDFSVSYVPPFPQNSVFHLPWFFRLLCSSISGRFRLAFPPFPWFFRFFSCIISAIFCLSCPPFPWLFSQCSISSGFRYSYPVISGLFCRPTVLAGRDEFDPGLFSVETEAQQYVLLGIISGCPKHPVFFCFLMSGNFRHS